MKLDEEGHALQVGFYYKFRVNDEIAYLKEGDVLKVPNSSVFIQFENGTFWVYTGKKLPTEDYYI